MHKTKFEYVKNNSKHIDSTIHDTTINIDLSFILQVFLHFDCYQLTRRIILRNYKELFRESNNEK